MNNICVDRKTYFSSTYLLLLFIKCTLFLFNSLFKCNNNNNKPFGILFILIIITYGYGTYKVPHIGILFNI